MAENNNEKNLQEAKELIKLFKELWSEETISHVTTSPKLVSIAHQIVSMKLSDKFLLDDLSDEEKEIVCDKIYVIANACK